MKVKSIKKLVLLLTLVSVSVSFARPNSHTNLIFGGGFGGAAYNDYMYSVPVGSESWAGFALSDTSIYPIVMASGAQVTFRAATVSGSPANMRLSFEYNPYPDVDPSYDTASVTISNDVLTEYTIDIPSQGANTFSSVLFFNETFGETIYMTDFILSGLDDGDDTPPTPNPASFSVAPLTVSDVSIVMRATSAFDVRGVEYYFACTTDSNFDSGWQSDNEYTVTGLTPSTTYSFTVQVRDTSYAENTTTASAAASATTSGGDSTPPSPNPTSATADATAVTIQITASPSADASGVEYKFTNTAGSGPSSDWQGSNVYTASGLEPGTAYTYSVQARDLSAAQNATTAGSVSATTLSISETTFTAALTDLSGTSDDGVTPHDLAGEGFEVASTTSGKAVTFNNTGVIFDIAGSGDSGRNHLISIADNFDAVDFNFEVTVTRSANSQQAFFGVGTGANGTWELPDFDQPGGAYMLQMQETDNSTYRVNNLGASTFNPEDDAANAASPLGTHRLRLVGNATARTFTISLDENYAGGDFVADSVQGSVFFDEIWDTSAQPTQNPNYDEDEEVYVPGGQTPSGQSNDGAWEEAAGGGAGAIYTYPETGGADDDGGYLQIDSSSGAWAVAVVSTDRNDPYGKFLPIADYGIAGDELITFEMDMKEFDNPSRTGTAGIKIEWYDANGSQISNTGDMKKSLTTEWATYRWNAGVPTDAVYIVLVPVQHDDITAGYDNLAFVPNPSVSGAIPTVARLIFGGDEGVTFKDFSVNIGNSDFDTDGDGLLDNDEVNVHSTDPIDADSDDDGLNDGNEVNVNFTDPNDADTDGDGLNDGDEINIHSTDPNDIDSDNDGINDGDEVTNGTNPLIANVKPVLDLDVFYEAQSGQTIIVDAIPIDGYPANYTYQWIHNGYPIPLLFGGSERTYTLLGDASYNGSWSVIAGNSMGFDTNSFVFEVFVDTDLDGLSDGRETYVTYTDTNDSDSDDDGLSDGDEINSYLTNPNNRDSDGDGFDDGFEVTIASNVFSPTSADNSIIDYIKAQPDLFDLSADGMTMSEAQAAMRDLRVGSQTFDVSNGTATIRMYVDESSDLTSSWTNTQHVLEVDIPADQDTMFYRFRMD